MCGEAQNAVPRSVNRKRINSFPIIQEKADSQSDHNQCKDRKTNNELTPMIRNKISIEKSCQHNEENNHSEHSVYLRLKRCMKKETFTMALLPQ